MKKSFSIAEALKYGYKTAKKDWLFFASITFFSIFFSQWLPMIAKRVLPVAFPQLDKDSVSIVVDIFQLIGIVFSLVIDIGIASVYLDIAKGKKRKITDIFSTHGLVKDYIGLSLVTGAYILIGLLCFIIPGIVMMIMYQYALYAMIEHRKGSTDAMNRSQKMTKGNRWKLLFFSLLSISLQLAGTAFFGIGYLFVTPVVKLADIYIYKKLSHS